MQSPRFKKNIFREKYYFFVLSRAWNKEKNLNPHRQWGTKNCFPLSHARDKTRNIFLYIFTGLKLSFLFCYNTLSHCETLSSKTQKMSIELSNTEIRILVCALK